MANMVSMSLMTRIVRSTAELRVLLRIRMLQWMILPANSSVIKVNYATPIISLVTAAARNPQAWSNQLVTDIDDGEYILLKGVDLKKGAKEFIVSASCLLYGGTIEVRIDDYNGACIGSVNVGCTQDQFKEVNTKIKGVKGVHDLYLVFKGDHRQKKNLFVLDWWKMR